MFVPTREPGSGWRWIRGISTCSIPQPDRPSESSGLLRPELQRFQLEEFVETELAELAAVARLLEATEWRLHVEAAAVDVDLAGAQPPRDLRCAFVAAGQYGAGEAVRRAVGDAYGVILVAISDDRQYRAEDLFLCDRRLGLDATEYRRFDVVALVEPFGCFR